jgi:hypothetical protein
VGVRTGRFLLPSPLFVLGTTYNIPSLISFGKDMRDVILKLVPRGGKKKGVRTSSIQEIKLQNYLPGESFLPVPVKY